MIEEKNSIWDARYDGMWRVIPINRRIKSNGRLVMGRGLAKEALSRHPDLDLAFAERLREELNFRKLAIVRYLGMKDVKLLGFPTKIHWRDDADLNLIEKGLIELKDIMPYLDADGAKIVCPRPGCGLGKLDWVTQVRPLMLKYFDDNDNFIVVNP